jgi:hypothetical protein
MPQSHHVLMAYYGDVIQKNGQSVIHLKVLEKTTLM